MNNRISAKYTPKGNWPGVPIIEVTVRNYADKSINAQCLFVIDSGADFTLIGNAVEKSLKLMPQSKRSWFDPSGNKITKPASKIIIEIPKLKICKSLTVAISSCKEYNFLGRDFLNEINVFLLGINQSFIIHVESYSRNLP